MTTIGGASRRARARLAWAVCSALLAHGIAATAESERTNVLIVLDASGSMAGRIGEQRKMELAKRVVTDLVENAPSDMGVGLVVYGARSPREKNDCGDIQLLEPVEVANAADVGRALGRVRPRGMTPIGAALRRAADALREQPGRSTIVLVSDGTETCDSNPCRVARELRERTGIEVKVHVVGLDVADAERGTLECVAEGGGGQYFSAANEAQLRTGLSEAIAGCQRQRAMWLSLAHPGLGEWRNARQGWEGMPKKKFGLGFVPLLGWPGYLQVVSAIDAYHCRTRDWLD